MRDHVGEDWVGFYFRLSWRPFPCWAIQASDSRCCTCIVCKTKRGLQRGINLNGRVTTYGAGKTGKILDVDQGISFWKAKIRDFYFVEKPYIREFYFVGEQISLGG